MASPDVPVRKTTLPTRPSLALLGASVLLPLLFFAIAAWQSHRVALREAGARVERTVRVLQEHAIKVFETNQLVIDRVNGRLRYMDWSREADRADLFAILKGLQHELDQIATITVTDAEGHLRASSRGYPFDTSISFADRDWFQALRSADSPRPIVSRSIIGRQSGQAVFNLAARATGPEPGVFDGVVAVSNDRAYFESFYKDVEPAIEHTVTLVRDDGQILARQPPTGVATLGPESALLQMGRHPTEAVRRVRSSIDGIERLASLRRIGDFPVFVSFGIGVGAALAPWRQDLRVYGLVAALAAAVLLAISTLAIRSAAREQAATQRWQEAATQLRAEALQRERAEDQARQSQKMEAVGRLTGGVAHDFNNLLTVVIGSLDLLKRRLEDGSAAHVRLIENALDGARRAATLTHRLLAFSRQQPLQPEPVEANKLVAGLSDLLQRTIGEAYEIETVLAGGLWQTLADANQLENALVNLAVNARDAMPEGGKLTIETANAHLDQSYAATRPDLKAGQYVMLAVTDTGSGMPPEVLAQVFEPFFTTKPVGKGTGLGLSQVYGFAKQSHGHCAIYSEVGHGTTVKLYLPRLVRVPEAPLPAIVAPAAPDLGERGETILLVEDEPLVREFGATVLREAGYRVLEAEDGAAGLALLGANAEVALLFTDVVLTGPMNGRQLADAAHRLRPGLRVLFTTGYTRNAIIHHGRLDDDVDLIGKPFTPDALAGAVRRSLDKPSGT